MRAEIAGVEAVAGAGGERADEADGTARTDRVGESKTLRGVVEFGPAFDRIRVDQVAPDADFGERNIMFRKGFFPFGQSVIVGSDERNRDIGGRIAEGAVGAGECVWIIAADGEPMAAETDGGHQTWFFQLYCGL